ncbi:alpha-amylase family protein [Paenibacillus xerothermodurans]|uniref:Amidase n=1 Tax=Paenibacillus xerothermodurans TaxID=1977292 RepID=A0A2W1NBN8_PAEXE|nr:alpha-amylase family protein [Paenibacillus xerothermodurans]PZE20511.1 hypothetical protein CBW46_012100 [Paenibacillus xerothermodurans]
MQTTQRSLWSKRVGKVVLSCFMAGQAFLGFPLFGGIENKAQAAEQPAVVSTWMWNPYVIGDDREGTLQQLSDKNVNRVYLFVDPTYPTAYYSNFIREAGARGIEVRALSGAPNWVLPEHNKKMYEFVHWVKQYNQQVQPEEKFDGIHLDVEPYVLPEWKQDSDAVIGLWRDTVSGFAEEVKSDSDLAVGMDMPVWLDKFNVSDGAGGSTTLADWMIRRVDQVTLMAYFDNAQQMAESVKDELNHANSAGVPLIMAVETVNNGDPRSSFYSHGNAAMLNQLNALTTAMGNNSSFQGHAVHEWDSWIKLD